MKVDPDRRQRDIKFIHAAARELGMDRSTYENMLFTLTCKRSCSQLDYTALQRVREHLNKCGAGRTGKQNEWGFIDGAAADRKPLLRKIYMLCKTMSVGKRYAEGVATLQHGIERRLEMMSAGELWLVAGALSRTQMFKEKSAAPPEGGISDGPART